VAKERRDCVTQITFQDENENRPTVLRAIAKKDELCTLLIFKSVRNFHEDVLVDKKGLTMGIIIK
jgi:hypothetical protein